jgi:hypothetical protein
VADRALADTLYRSSGTSFADLVRSGLRARSSTVYAVATGRPFVARDLHDGDPLIRKR